MLKKSSFVGRPQSANQTTKHPVIESAIYPSNISLLNQSSNFPGYDLSFNDIFEPKLILKIKAAVGQSFNDLSLLTIIPWASVRYKMVNSQRGA